MGFHSPSGGGGTTVHLIHIREEQAQNTQSGTFTTGAWRTRVLNTEVTDTGSLASLASNQITLAAGSYEVFAWAPAYQVDRHQCRLYNITDTAVILYGRSGYAPNASAINDISLLQGYFTLAAQKVIELQHSCATTFANQGFGLEGNQATEVYASIVLKQYS